MTALDRYELLEAEGRYRERPEEPARAVILTFGERALTIMSGDGTALAHWPLASLRAVPGARLTMAPGAGSSERLETADGDMIAAIAEVCPDLHGGRGAAIPIADHRSWRGLVRLAAAAALLTAMVLAASPWLRAPVAGLVPEARMRAFEAALADAAAPLAAAGATAERCTDPGAEAALAALARRLSGEAPAPEIRVQRHTGPEILALPGNRILIGNALIARADSPERLAGAIAHAIGHLRSGPPGAVALQAIGWRGLAVLAFGDDPPGGIATAAAAALVARHHDDAAERRADAVALEILAAAGLPAAPYAGFVTLRHPGTGRAAAARAADTMGGAAFTPALADRDWVALQGICG